ncbi:hypothetical protein L207DRAFT_382190, partial [Hyaloscypha variabilis F]
RSWLSTCLEKHDMCNTHDNRFLPRRLLKVTLTNHRLGLKLCQIDPDMNDVQYLTLSYCWGEGYHFKLTPAKPDIFLKSIALSDLPQTLLDAVAITARLGYEYIWIDALCIMQTDAQAWSEEKLEDLRNMGKVCKNSECTIAALAAKFSDEGCFTSR